MKGEEKLLFFVHMYLDFNDHQTVHVLPVFPTQNLMSLFIWTSLVSVYSFVFDLLMFFQFYIPAWAPEHPVTCWYCVIMAADENHMISLMDGDDTESGEPSLADGQMGDAGSVCDSFPLQDFVRAKEKINEIFVEMEDYVRDTVTCLQSKYKGKLTWTGQGKLEF